MIAYYDIALVGAGVFLGILIIAGSYIIWLLAKQRVEKLVHDTIEIMLDKSEDGKVEVYKFKEKKDKK